MSDTTRMQYGIPQYAWMQIIDVLARHPKITRVRLFGSRARGDFRATSDIDLCIDAEGLSMSEKFAIENSLDDLLLPWKIDLVVLHMIDQPALRDQIDRNGITLTHWRRPQENT